MNHMKSQHKFPECLEACSIINIYKNKGPRKDLNLWRGIFRVNVSRSILDKLIYIDKHELIDKKLNDSNVRGRRGRNVRDNIFIQETKNAKISIKTATSERVDIHNTIIHGTVFRSLICTAVVDKLAKIFYSDKNLLYVYKWNVDVPILSMVDNVGMWINVQIKQWLLMPQ